MGDPWQKIYKGDNGETYAVTAEDEAAFHAAMQKAGIQVTADESPVGPMPGMHYGPEDPALQDGPPASAPGPLPQSSENFGYDTSSGTNEYGNPKKLAQQQPVPPQPYFPPKDPALAASDAAAVAAAMARGGGTADVPLRGSDAVGSGAVGSDLDAGVPGDMSTGVSNEFADEGAGEVPPAAPVDPKLQASREELAASDARRSGQAPLELGDRTSGRGVDSPRISELEAAGRGFLDAAAYGFGDEAVGIGGFARGLLKPTVRPLGPDPSLMDRFESAKAEGGDYMRRYAEGDKKAFEAHPGAQFAGGVIPAVVQSAAGRWLMPSAGMIQEGAEVARRAGPGVGKLIERAAAGAKDAIFNKGSAIQSALSGAGHAEGPDPASWLASAASGAAGEHIAGAAMAAPAELALAPFRAVGRYVSEMLSDPKANPETAHLHQLARAAGAQYETLPRPAGGAKGPAYPMTSGRGVRPSPESADLMAKARDAGPGELAPRLRGEAAKSVANALDTEAQTFQKDLGDRRKKHYATPAAAANDRAGLEVLQAAPADIRRELVAKMREFAEHRSVQGRPAPTDRMDAEMLDQLINYVDDEGKTYARAAQHGNITRYEALAKELRDIRKNHFGTARWIAETHADKMRAHEARKTLMGIPAESKGVDPTTRGKDTQAIDQRLARGPTTALMDEIADIEAGDPNLGRAPDPETAEVLRQWAGIDAQQRLITGAKDEGLDIGVRAGRGPGLLARVGEVLPSINRVAGLENLGLHTQAGLRGGMREAWQDLVPGGDQVTPEEVANLARLLGYENQSPADLERIYQLLGKHPNQSTQGQP